jgi:hypothetical protein
MELDAMSRTLVEAKDYNLLTREGVAALSAALASLKHSLAELQYLLSKEPK